MLYTPCTSLIHPLYIPYPLGGAHRLAMGTQWLAWIPVTQPGQQPGPGGEWGVGGGGPAGKRAPIYPYPRPHKGNPRG